MSTDRFQVWTFYENETYREVPKLGNGRYTAEEAVLKAKELVEQGGDATGLFYKIMITDSDDNCSFEWRRGSGIIFPPKN